VNVREPLSDDRALLFPDVLTVSIIGWVVIAVLVLAQITSYLTPTIKEHMVVDTTLGTQLRININVTFHALTCAEVRVTTCRRASNCPCSCSLSLHSFQPLILSAPHVSYA
jgi:Endoplasmic Reticulum-Golgi Intermediate Compartment (ERGIC)